MTKEEVIADLLWDLYQRGRLDFGTVSVSKKGGGFERWERNEDKVKEELKHWVDQHPGEDTFVKWVCDTIEAVDKAQDEIVNKIVWKVYQTLINNRDSNKLWKAYEPKGNYYHRNHKMPLFERGGKENG